MKENMTLKNSFFTFMDEAELRIIRAYPEHTDVFERAADECKQLFGFVIPEPKPSKGRMHAQFYYFKTIITYFETTKTTRHAFKSVYSENIPCQIMPPLFSPRPIVAFDINIIKPRSMFGIIVFNHN